MGATIDSFGIMHTNNRISNDDKFINQPDRPIVNGYRQSNINSFWMKNNKKSFSTRLFV